jgi:outer membrane protein TolC
MLAMAVIGVSITGVGGCGLKQPDPWRPRIEQRPEEVATLSAPPPNMPALPTTMPQLAPADDMTATTTQPTPAPADTQPTTAPAATNASVSGELERHTIIRMSIEEIVHRAVLNSKEVRVSGYDAAIAKTRILENQAHFDPVAYSQVQYQDQKVLTPSSGTLVTNPFSPEIFRTLDIQTGLKQNLPSGGTVDLRYEIQRIQQVPAGSINPYFLNDVVLQVQQPLLQNFGYDVNQARISIARNDYRVSLLDFRNKLEDNLTEIEKDYWQQVEAEHELRVERELLARSNETYRILLERFRNGGDVSRLQLSQATSRIEAQRATLERAQSRLGDTSTNMKRRMNDPEFPVAGDVWILPVEHSETEVELHFDKDDQIKTALANRYELGQQTVRIDSASMAAEVARNNLLPKLNLTGTLQVQGPGKDIGRAFDEQGRADYIGGAIGFDFEFPLGNREGRAIYRRAMLQRIQAMTQYKFLIDQVSEDVDTAIREVETSWREIGQRRRARFSAADYLLALQQRQEQGVPLDSNFLQLLLDAQEQLAEAQRQEALAVASYDVAIVRLERAKGTLLRYNNVIMQEEPFTTMER